VRILRIAGQNLASLLDFELDLQQPPLAEAGLFAITGPTGAGKSTLLDALCLALYNSTPRMAGAQTSAKVADLESLDDKQELVSATDVRLLLRRGAAKGFAEVDFLAIDGRRYRSRWSVTRAYGKPDGRLQNATMLLSRLESHGEVPDCSGRTEVVQRVTALLGLHFDQFCRAVVLAQGDFAAFLRAKPEERAELLERMTDTGIYGEISRQAHAESSWWRGQTQTLAQARSLLALPSADERAALQAKLEALTAEIVQADADAELARTFGLWHERAAALAEEQTEADGRHARAKHALGELAPVIVDLRRIDQALGLEPLWRHHLRAREQATQTTAELERLRTVQAEAEAEVRAAGEHAGKWADVVAQSEAAKAAAQPELWQARDLDTRLEVAQAELASRRQQAAENEQLWQTRLAEHQRLAQEVAARGAELAVLQAWLAEHPDGGWLAADWGSTLLRLTQVVALASKRQSSLYALAESQSRYQLARDAVGAAEQVWKEARQRADEAMARAENARRDAATADAGDPSGQASAAQRHLQQLQDALAILQDEQTGHDATQALMAAVARHEREAGAAADVEVAARTEAERCALQLAEAHQSLRLMQAELDVADLRPLLQPEQPCPLCGSLAHPWATQAPPAPLLARQQARIHALQQAQSLAQARAAEGLAAVRTALAAAARAHQDLEQAAHTSTARQQRWAELVPTAPALVDPDVPTWLAARLDDARTVAAAALAAVTARDQLNAAAQAAKEGAWQAQVAAEQAHGRHVLEVQREHEAAQAEQWAATALAETQTAMASLRDALDGHWQRQPAWLARFEANPQELEAAWLSEVEQWQHQQAAAEACSKALTTAASAHALSSATCDALKLRHEESRAGVVDATATVDALLVSRGKVCAGEPADVVEARLQAALERAVAAHSASIERQTEAQTQWLEVTARSAAVEASRRHADEQAAAARAEIAATLADAGMSEGELAEQLARPTEHTARLRDAVEDARQALAHVEGVLADLAERRAEHAARAPELTAAAVAARLNDAEHRAAVGRDQRGQTWQQLQQLAEVEQQGRELADRLAQLQAAAAPWLALDDLLGSSDGKKFRNYAQGLTLDALIGHANGYLVELARRYRLERVPGAHLDLQIRDLDMGGEVRAITTLSGGEGFLVSLALALGLSSLSSRAQTIGTLFIDEGFGTLDGDTLETAIAVLDGLQAAGRQVGIISHVAGLAERIGVQVQVRPQGAGRSKVSLVRG
jgi:exonuclease SbcC